MTNEKQSISDFNWRFWVPVYGPAKAVRNFAKRDGPSPMYDGPTNVSFAKQTARGLASYGWFLYSTATSGVALVASLRGYDALKTSLEKLF